MSDNERDPGQPRPVIIDANQFYDSIKPWPDNVELLPWNKEYPEEVQPMLNHGIGKDPTPIDDTDWVVRYLDGRRAVVTDKWFKSFYKLH